MPTAKTRSKGPFKRIFGKKVEKNTVAVDTEPSAGSWMTLHGDVSSTYGDQSHWMTFDENGAPQVGYQGGSNDASYGNYSGLAAPGNYGNSSYIYQSPGYNNNQQQSYPAWEVSTYGSYSGQSSPHAHYESTAMDPADRGIGSYTAGASYASTGGVRQPSADYGSISSVPPVPNIYNVPIFQNDGRLYGWSSGSQRPTDTNYRAMPASPPDDAGQYVSARTSDKRASSDEQANYDDAATLKGRPRSDDWDDWSDDDMDIDESPIYPIPPEHLNVTHFLTPSDIGYQAFQTLLGQRLEEPKPFVYIGQTEEGNFRVYFSDNESIYRIVNNNFLQNNDIDLNQLTPCTPENLAQAHRQEVEKRLRASLSSQSGPSVSSTQTDAASTEEHRAKENAVGDDGLPAYGSTERVLDHQSVISEVEVAITNINDLDLDGIGSLQAKINRAKEVYQDNADKVMALDEVSQALSDAFWAKEKASFSSDFDPASRIDLAESFAHQQSDKPPITKGYTSESPANSQVEYGSISATSDHNTQALIDELKQALADTETLVYDDQIQDYLERFDQIYKASAADLAKEIQKATDSYDGSPDKAAHVRNVTQRYVDLVNAQDMIRQLDSNIGLLVDEKLHDRMSALLDKVDSVKVSKRQRQEHTSSSHYASTDLLAKKNNTQTSQYDSTPLQEGKERKKAQKAREALTKVMEKIPQTPPPVPSREGRPELSKESQEFNKRNKKKL